MVEVWRIALNLVSLAINIGLIYVAFRTLMVFKSGKMSTPWLYIISGVLTLAVGSGLFAFYYIFDLYPIIHPIGGLFMMISGILILIGLYTQFRIWTR